LDRVNMMGALKHLQQQWEATYNAIHDPVVILDGEGIILRTNMAAVHLVKTAPTLPERLRSFRPEDGLLKLDHREFQHLEAPFKHGDKDLRLVQLRELTEERELLQQLLHSEKLASVGIVSEKVA